MRYSPVELGGVLIMRASTMTPGRGLPPKHTARGHIDSCEPDYSRHGASVHSSTDFLLVFAPATATNFDTAAVAADSGSQDIDVVR